jgi:hypothetical protein
VHLFGYYHKNVIIRILIQSSFYVLNFICPYADQISPKLSAQIKSLIRPAVEWRIRVCNITELFENSVMYWEDNLLERYFQLVSTNVPLYSCGFHKMFRWRCSQTVPCLRLLMSCLSLWRIGFSFRLVHVEFVVEKYHWSRYFSEYFSLLISFKECSISFISIRSRTSLKTTLKNKTQKVVKAKLCRCLGFLLRLVQVPVSNACSEQSYF